MTEIWCPILGYENLYDVSNLGRVRSRDRYVQLGHPGSAPRLQPGRILKPDVVRNRYGQVTLCNDGSRKAVRVHRLVLEAFVGPCPDGMEGCHNDGDSLNNAVENLRWDTRTANAADQLLHGTHGNAFRTRCIHNHEFTPENTYHVVQNGRWRRMCRACRHDRDKARRQSSKGSMSR